MIEQVGKYKVIKEIGKGGMGAVLLGMHPTLNRKVAIKMLTRELVSNQEFIQRFEREAKIIATLDHPNIVQVYDYEEAMGTYFIIMEFVEGKELSDVIKKGQPMPLDQVAAIMSQIARALAYAHAKGIVHRDIKPGNAMMRADGAIKLMDFGIAFSETSDVHLTQEGKVIGTPKYMSPEQLQGKKIDLRSDIYSLGVMCYEMLTGTPPFEGKDFITIAAKHLREEPVPIKNIVPSIGPEMEAFVTKALIKDREKRLATLEGLQLAEGKDESTIYFESMQKKGVSKKFFYITSVIAILILGGILFAAKMRTDMDAEKGFQEQITKIANKEVRSLVDEAKGFYEKNDFKSALALLEKAGMIDSKNPVVQKGIETTKKKLAEANQKKIQELEQKAAVSYQNKKYLDAISAWKEILLTDKTRKDIQKKVADTQKILDQEQDVLISARRIDKGYELEAAGDLEGAEKEYLEAYRLNPASEQAPYSLGLLYSLKYELSEDKEKNRDMIGTAIRYFQEALKAAPQHKGILKNIAYAYLSDSNKEKAKEYAQELIRVDENEGNSLLELINSY